MRVSLVQKNLPPGWVEGTIGDVTIQKVPQRNPPLDSHFIYIDISSIDNQTKEVTSPKSLAGTEAPSRARQAVCAGDVLVSLTRPNLNAVAVVPKELDKSIASTGFDVLRAIEVESRWLFNLVRSQDFVSHMTALVQGALYPAIRSENVRSYKIPIPPIKEQERIVGQIDELQRRSRRVREALEDIPDLLDQLRQSVLAAAFRGDLTKEWRAKHPDVEPASDLLKRIRIERRNRWEEAELEKLKAKGLIGEKLSVVFEQRRKGYREPEPVDTANLPDLHQSWCWANWDLLSDWVTYGFTRPMPHVSEGPAIITAKNVVLGRIDFESAARTGLEEFNALSPKDRPLSGDILVTKDGTIGRAAIVPERVPPFCINQSVAVIWLRSCPADRSYLLRAIETPWTQRRIADFARGMAIQHLSIIDFAKVPLPFAPIEEQTEIAQVLESYLWQIEKTREDVKKGISSLDQLDQTILTSAFRGRLVPQDPNDEPASVLIDRIRGDKVGGAPGQSHKRRGKKSKTKET